MKYFSSEIENKKISDFQKYDASINKYDERLSLVNELIRGDDNNIHEFFTTYFSQYYNVSPNQNGFLSEQDAVCRTIEGLGTYLLNSKDIQSNRKIEYRFWKSEREYNNYKESENISASSLEADNESESNVEIVDLFFTNDDKGTMKSKTIVVNSQDINEIHEIKALQELIDKSKSKSFIKSIENYIDETIPYVQDEKDVNRLKSIRANVERYINSWVSNARENQVLIKKAVKVPFDFNGGTRVLTNKDKLEGVDFYDETVVKKMLPMLGREEDLMSDIGIMIYDFNNLLIQVKLSTRERQIIDLFKMGYRQKDLGEKLGINKRTVSDTIGRIAKKVTETYVKQLYINAKNNSKKNN